jgi:hypothetical protein
MDLVARTWHGQIVGETKAKPQKPNSKQFGVWDLGFGVYLGFGIWDLGFSYPL